MYCLQVEFTRRKASADPSDYCEILLNVEGSESNMERGSRKTGFTLIELLVVIAIIAILAAILFPVFAQAREKARTTSCLSNFKQVGLAIEMYKTDYDGHWPLWWNGDENHIGNVTYGRFWAGAIDPYVKNNQLRKCPSDPYPTPPSYPNKDSSGNDTLGGTVQSMTSNRNIQFDERKTLDGTWLHPSMAESEIANVARTVSVHEAVGADEGRTTPIQDSYTGWWGANEMAYGDTHHNKGGNYVFFDGHAKWLRPSNVEPCPPNAGWGTSPGPDGITYNLLPNPNYITGLEPRFRGRQATFCTSE